MDQSVSQMSPRVRALIRRHAELETKLEELGRHPGVADEEKTKIKRQKLQVKDALHGHFR